MNAKDRRELGSLLEDEAQPNGLITDWVEVRRACDQFDKSCRWLDDSDMAGSIVRRWKVPLVTEMSKQSGPTKRTMGDNDVKMKMDMDNMAKEDDKSVETSSPLVLGTWRIVYSNHCKTQETKGGDEEVKYKPMHTTKRPNKAQHSITSKVNREKMGWYFKCDHDIQLKGGH